MDPEIAFYRLSRKVVNNEEKIPEQARQVMYYSLAIGHHIGVMDCFSELMVVPAQLYKHCLDQMPMGGARRKLEGALEWSEIEINRSHVDELLPALSGLVRAVDGKDTDWVTAMIRCLKEMVDEPALYLMVKMRQ